jgi:hypothetical protein
MKRNSSGKCFDEVHFWVRGIIIFVSPVLTVFRRILVFDYKSMGCKKIVFGIKFVMLSSMKKSKEERVKILLTIFLTFGIFLAGAVPAYSFQWYFAASKKNSYFFVDSENVEITGTNVTFWVMSVNPETGKVLSTKKCTIDCAVDIIVVKEVVRHGFHGTSVESYTNNLDWYAIPPDSATESIERLLCSDGEPRKDIRKYLMKLFSK